MVREDPNEWVVYDLRSGVLEKLERYKEALVDARKSINLKPTRWQAYARSARLFLALDRPESALVMIEHAVKRFDHQDPTSSSSNSQTTPATRPAAVPELQAMKSKALNRISTKRGVLPTGQLCYIGRLPVELLTSIMTYLANLDYNDVFRIAITCRHWRSIALQAPHLWHTMALQHHPSKLRIANAVLQRSNGRIKTLRVHASVKDHWNDFEPLFSHLSWPSLRILQIYGGQTNACQEILRIISTVSTVSLLTNLEELAVQTEPALLPGVRRFHSLSCGRICECAGTTNTLKSISLSNFAVSPATLPHGTLVHLRLEDCGITDHPNTLHDLLSQNSALETLVLNVALFNHDPLTGVTFNAPLSKLTRLELRCPHDLTPLFSCLDLPALRFLRLLSLTAPVDRMLSAILSKSGAPSLIEELSIENCFVDEPARVLQLIKAMHFIRSLELVRIGTGVNAVVSGLANSGDPLDAELMEEGLPAQLPCPRLAHVNFSHCFDLRTSPILSLVKGRLPSHRPLPERVLTHGEPSSGHAVVSPFPNHSKIRSMVIDGCPLIEPESLPWLRQQVKTFSCSYMTKKQAAYRR